MVELIAVLLGTGIGLVVKLAKFFFTHLVGTILLAVVGGMFLCGGCVGVATVTHESAPTKVSIADLEAKGLPSQNWLEITDGYLFWPMWIKDLWETTENGQVVKKETKGHLVPLVSKAVLDQWMDEFNKHSFDANFDYEKCRVIVKLDAADFEKAFPGISGNSLDLSKPYTQATITGEKTDFKGERTEILKELGAHTKNLKSWDQMALVKYGSSPIGKGGMACMAFFGLLWFVPLGILVVRRFMGKTSSVAAVPVSSKHPGHYGDHGVSFEYPPEWGVETKRIGTGDDWTISLNPPRGSVLVQVYCAQYPDMAETMRKSLQETPVYAKAQFTPSGGILAGQPAKGYDIQAEVLGMKQVGQLHVAEIGRRTVILNWNVSEENKADLLKGVNQIRNTLKA